VNIELKPDYALNDAACQEATGQTLSYWISAIEAKPELRGKRRDAVNMWLYPEMGKNIWWATTAWVEFERKLGIIQKDGRIEGYNICVTKTINAPVAKTFAAWTTGDLPWLGDSAQVYEDKSIIDANGNRATPVRIRENKDLRYKWNACCGCQETSFDVTFTDNGKGGTALMLNHNRIQTRAEADGLRRAWGAAFNRLKSSLE
jgi:uncharacterized protein YndB with AHSA1/START domain